MRRKDYRKIWKKDKGRNEGEEKSKWEMKQRKEGGTEGENEKK